VAEKVRSPDGLSLVDPSLRRRFTGTGVAVLVPTYKSLPARGARPGELAFLRTGTGLYLYYWSETAWVLLATPGGMEQHNLFSIVHPDVDETDTPQADDVLTYEDGKWKAKPSGGGMVQHGDEYHTGRIEDAGASLPGSGENGELLYLTADKHIYLYQT